MFRSLAKRPIESAPSPSWAAIFRARSTIRCRVWVPFVGPCAACILLFFFKNLLLPDLRTEYLYERSFHLPLRNRFRVFLIFKVWFSWLAPYVIPLLYILCVTIMGL